MEFLRKQLKNIEKHFVRGGRFERFFPLYEAIDTFLFTPGEVTTTAPHVRDAIDLKRVMSFVVVALIPCIATGIYNTGYQILVAKGLPLNFWEVVLLGLKKVMPIILVTYAVGGFWEVVFAIVRRHEINEGFLVTGILFALILPPSIPLWQVAVGISFGVVIGKEIFGGTGMNVLNPALVGRAFLFFAYPAQISGDSVWVAVDGITRATPLSVVATAGRGESAVGALQAAGYTFKEMLVGLIPGSIGETSALACLLGLVFLLITRIVNWRIVAGCFLGSFGMSLFFFMMRSPNRLAFFSLPPQWHLIMGGLAFGAIFMATDPVSACATNTGRWIYGTMIGVLTILIRVLNPAYPEGTMLAILFMNIFAPLIDYFVVEAHIRRRTIKVRGS